MDWPDRRSVHNIGRWPVGFANLTERKETTMFMNGYLKSTASAIRLDKLIRHEKGPLFPDRMSSRMVKCASVLNQGEHTGWQMEVPVRGLVQISVFGSVGLCRGDLEWIAEHMGKTVAARLSTGQESGLLDELYEFYLPAAENAAGSAIGFGASVSGGTSNNFPQRPSRYSSQFGEIVRTIREFGGVFRAVIGPASEEERLACRKNTLRTFDANGIAPQSYIGRPVKLRVLLRLPQYPTVRFRTVFEEAIPQARLRHLGGMVSAEARRVWDDPLEGATVLPDYAARILMMEPELREPVIGIELCEEPAKPIPASHKNPKDKGAVTIGRAMLTSGTKRRITIGELDLRRHYQIVGQTGTGKSPLLAGLILSAVEQGHGLTFFDPHGSTIDTVLRTLPERYVGKVRVVRIGNADYPVPLNIWDSDDPVKEERNISDLCELFSDIFDPNRQGFVGPRYERWLSTFAKASIAFLGHRASLESIAVISQSQDNMLKLSKAIVGQYPQIVETIKQEYGTDKSSDFQNLLNWYLCKFQRLTSVEQLRKTLGAGANALDFARSVDTDTVTLIDLASPIIGTHAARIVGTLTLMKLWNAAMARQERDRTHLVVVDEASLFQTNPMPRMLAEGRKFGISMVLCHQHTGQLTPEVRDALDANSANFTAFRLSQRDAYTAAMRFDDPGMQTALIRLDAFRAITTLSVDGRQTAPFTLEIQRPRKQKNGEQIAAEIESRSIETLVTPYLDLRALTGTEIQEMLNHPADEVDEVVLAPMPITSVPIPAPPVPVSKPEAAWLKEWKCRRAEMRFAI